MTADEKREADRIRGRNARLALTARLMTAEEITAQADAYEAGLAAHRAAQAAGTTPTYHSFSVSWPAGDEYVVDRVKIDEGKARAYGVADELDRRGLDPSRMMGFGIAAGRSSIEYRIEVR
jgi:hypothetical protein